ncbi:MAG: diadenylate cyclase [Anaplasmataceae bacterium]|nr:diadenylate cyclase [Anaplasmataceae bacterium]
MSNVSSSLLALIGDNLVSLRFTPIDIVDILIIAFLIYVGLRLVIETNSVSMIIGLFLLFVLYGLALLFNLVLSRVILQSIVSILVIVIAIVYQNELRRILNFFTILGFARHRQSWSEKVVFALSEAAFSLAASRQGALLVLPGREPVDPYITSGEKLDGFVSQPVLMSIFDASSPGHDGAVIIERDRITSFGVHLPLAENMTTLTQYGTRHRAALGLSEKTDALTVVVSEEKGVVNIARQGKLQSIQSKEELIVELQRFYLDRFPRERTKSFFANFAKNTFIVGLTLVLAVGLWIVNARSSPPVQRQFTVNLEFQNVAPGYVVQESVPSQIEVTLEGRSNDFDNFFPEKDLKALLDLSSAIEGSNSIVIDKKTIRTPLSFTIVRINPEKIWVRVEESQQILETTEAN